MQRKNASAKFFQKKNFADAKKNLCTKKTLQAKNFADAKCFFFAAAKFLLAQKKLCREEVWQRVVLDVRTLFVYVVNPCPGERSRLRVCLGSIGDKQTEYVSNDRRCHPRWTIFEKNNILNCKVDKLSVFKFF